MARAAAGRNGVRMFDTFTGFKFMAEKIKELETAGSHEYLLAFRSRTGILWAAFAGTGRCHGVDDDSRACGVLQDRGKTLYEAMRDLYEKYGSYAEETINIVMPGIDGLEKMEKLMSGLRENPPESIAGTEVLRVRDYLGGKIFDFKSRETSETEISGSNVLYFELSDDTRFIIRPSGTEPKIKIYILTHADSMEECGERISKYRAAAEKLKE